MLFAQHALHQTLQRPDAVLEALEALPEAITDHRAARVPAAARKAARAWAQAKETLLPRLPSTEQERFQSAMEGLHAPDAHAAAMSALDASDILLALVPEGRARELRRADQDGMRAWIRVEEGKWDRVPDLNRSFAWLLAHDDGRHTKAVIEVQAALNAFNADRTTKNRTPALHEVQRLLDLVDVLER